MNHSGQCVEETKEMSSPADRGPVKKEVRWRDEERDEERERLSHTNVNHIHMDLHVTVVCRPEWLMSSLRVYIYTFMYAYRPHE